MAHQTTHSRTAWSGLSSDISLPVILLAAILLTTNAAYSMAGASASAETAFNSYTHRLEERLDQQHRAANGFVAEGLQTRARARRGELLVEQLTPAKDAEPEGAMLHHWRGTAFVDGATAGDFERLMKDFNDYPRYFAPQVIQGRVLARQGDHFVAKMRVRQHHVLTVVMDTTYDVGFGRLDARHGYSTSRSAEIREIDAAGSGHERALSANEEHGYLWRLNSYWSYEEADGGLYIQIESVSLTRDIPRGLGWAVRPFVQSIPRESLAFTLGATRGALRSKNVGEGEKR